MPIWPVEVGSVTISTAPENSVPVGVTISSSNVVNAALHVKAIFGDRVVLAVQNLLEAANGFPNRHLLAVPSGERLRDAERLAEEALNFACAEDGDFVLGRELVDAENGDDVLQIDRKSTRLNSSHRT